MPVIFIIQVSEKRKNNSGYWLGSWFLVRQHDVFFCNQFSQIDQCIPHPSQGCIDTHFGLLCNIFKAQAGITPEVDHFLLFLG